MRKLTLLFLLLLTNVAFGQTDEDQTIDVKAKSTMDKIPEPNLSVPDSLNLINKTEDKIEDIQQNVQDSIDSLSKVVGDKIIPNQITSSNDSINNLMKNVDQFTPKSPLDKIPLNPDNQIIPVVETKLGDELNAVDPLKEVPAFKEIKDKSNAVQGTVNDELNSIKEQSGLNKIKNEMNDVKEVRQNIGEASDDIKSLKEGVAIDSTAVKDKLEQKLTDEVEGLKELNAESSVIENQKSELEKQKEEYLKQVLKYQDIEYIKEQYKDKQMQINTDHFEGKEEKLEAAKTELSKIKKKYGSVESIKDLPVIRPNVMKQRPFKDRIAAGLFTQIHQSPTKAFDISPCIGYKISGIFTSGLGYTYRVDLGERGNNINADNPIYGYRIYTEAKIYKGFFAHAEVEQLRTPYKVDSTMAEFNKRLWATSVFIGGGASYKIKGIINGYSIIEYNLNYDRFKSPYNNRLVLRVGVMLQK